MQELCAQRANIEWQWLFSFLELFGEKNYFTLNQGKYSGRPFRMLFLVPSSELRSLDEEKDVVCPLAIFVGVSK